MQVSFDSRNESRSGSVICDLNALQRLACWVDSLVASHHYDKICHSTYNDMSINVPPHIETAPLSYPALLSERLRLRGAEPRPDSFEKFLWQHPFCIAMNIERDPSHSLKAECLFKNGAATA